MLLLSTLLGSEPAALVTTHHAPLHIISPLPHYTHTMHYSSVSFHTGGVSRPDSTTILQHTMVSPLSPLKCNSYTSHPPSSSARVVLKLPGTNDKPTAAAADPHFIPPHSSFTLLHPPSPPPPPPSSSTTTARCLPPPPLPTHMT